MKLIPTFIFLLISTLCLSSCDRIRHKAELVIHKSKEEGKQQAKKAIERLFPTFDAYKPDTENNKQRFKDFLKVELTQDIKNIYCFDDAIGIDADYMFAFDCNPSTAEKIIVVNNLAIDTLNLDISGLWHDFEWWDKERIRQLQKYSWTNGDRYYKYFWYDMERGKAYFFDYDI